MEPLEPPPGSATDFGDNFMSLERHQLFCKIQDVRNCKIFVQNAYAIDSLKLRSKSKKLLNGRVDISCFV